MLSLCLPLLETRLTLHLPPDAEMKAQCIVVTVLLVVILTD